MTQTRQDPSVREVPLCVWLVPDVLPNSVETEALLASARDGASSVFASWLGTDDPQAQAGDGAASSLPFGPAGPPCPEPVRQALGSARSEGRRLVLLSRTDPGVAARVASELDLFDEIVHVNGAASGPAELRTRLGADAYDLLVFRSAGGELAKGARAVVRVRDPDAPPLWRTIARMLRVHQWIKNLLIFIPVLAGQQFDRPDVVLAAGVAFLAFSLVASAVYVVNDLLDLQDDRQHPTKRHRPLASGRLPAWSALPLLAVVLGGASVLTFLFLPPRFSWAVGAYLVVTFAYSLKLKQAVLVDVLTLAGLYTLRVLAGSAATGIEPSVWLLGLSFFLFTSLALVKRYAELHQHLASGPATQARPLPGRSYRPGDLPVLIALGVGTGCMAVLVLALYLISDEFALHYTHPFFLWQLCPLLLYWIGRAWIVVSRDEMDDDPVIWAVQDQLSRWVVLMGVVLVLLAR